MTIDFVRDEFRAQVEALCEGAPAPPVSAVKERARALRVETAQVSSDSAPAGAGAGRRRSRGPVAVVGLAAALLAAFLVVQTQPLHGRNPSSTALAELTHRAAVAAQARPAVVPPGPGQFLHIHTVALNGTTEIFGRTAHYYLQPETYDAWLSADGSAPGLIHKTFGAAVYQSDPDRQLFEQQGQAAPKHAGDSVQNAAPVGEKPEFTYESLNALPRDRAGLTKWIQEHRGSSPEQIFTAAGDMLKFSYAPPQLVAALYDVLGAVPGATIVQGVTDRAGRQGDAVELRNDRNRHQLIFNAEDGTYLGERIIASGNIVGWPTGTVVQDTATTINIVDTVGA